MEYYYTFTGTKQDLDKILSFESISSESLSSEEINFLSHLLIYTSNTEVGINNMYSSGRATNDFDTGYTFLLKNSLYSIKISACAFEILKILAKIHFCPSPITSFESIAEAAFAICTNAFAKVDTKAYCLYKKLLTSVWRQKHIKFTISELENSFIVSKCNTDFPQDLRCPYMGNDNESCDFKKEDIRDALKRLECKKLINQTSETEFSLIL